MKFEVVESTEEMTVAVLVSGAKPRPSPITRRRTEYLPTVLIIRWLRRDLGKWLAQELTLAGPTLKADGSTGRPWCEEQPWHTDTGLPDWVGAQIIACHPDPAQRATVHGGSQ